MIWFLQKCLLKLTNNTVMNKKVIGELLPKVTQKIIQLKAILSSLGYSPKQIVLELCKLFEIDTSSPCSISDDHLLLRQLLETALVKTGSVSKGLTDMLVALEAKISSFQKDQAELIAKESVENQTKTTQGIKKEKMKKKKSGDKKKAGKARQNRWQEGRMAVLGAYMQQSRQMMNSMRKLIMFKDILEKQVIGQQLGQVFVPFSQILA